MNNQSRSIKEYEVPYNQEYVKDAIKDSNEQNIDETKNKHLSPDHEQKESKAQSWNEIMGRTGSKSDKSK